VTKKEQSMRQRTNQWRLTAAACLCIAGLATAVSAQTSTSVEVKQFEVVSVDGSKVVAKTATGAKEYTLPSDFKFTTADGKQLAVQDLKPGMKGTARITTTTTTVPVYVTEIKNGEVVQKSGNSVIVRSASGIKMFSEGDLEKRNITIVKDGKAVGLSDLNTGDKLTASIVTAGTPRVLTERQLQATLSGSGAGMATKTTASSGAASSRASTGAAPAMSEPAAAKKLPKTASQMPLVGLIGALSLAAGLSLTIARKRRNSMF
jgi:LPXTG-motif cell wall-anchored protein